MSTATLASLLAESRLTGRRIAALPPELAPASPEAAYRVQDAVAQRLGAGIAGWKVGAATPAEEPVCAPLYADLVWPSPARTRVTEASTRGVEAELALRLGRDLPPRGSAYDADEAWDAVASLHVAIELLDSRYADRNAASVLARLADNITNGGFCYGPAVAGWHAVDYLTQPSSLLIDGVVARSAVGGNPVGHPRRLLGWLANHCIGRGRPLRAGDVVTTGSHTGILFAPVGATVTARFAGLGEASLVLAGD